jgi:TetR/AcrR family transcriptional regulator, repressor for uid operon
MSPAHGAAAAKLVLVKSYGKDKYNNPQSAQLLQLENERSFSFFLTGDPFCENERSFSRIGVMMTEALALTPDISPKTEARRATILEAAQSVFMRKGFDLTTMQDVASACNMSAGNLYRYFDSKSAIVSGLVERDRTQMASQFAELAKSPDQIEGFEKLGRVYIKDEIARKAPLTLEIWAAASRNNELKDMCVAMENTVTANMREFMGRAAAQGGIADGVDAELVTHLVIALVQSMFRDAVLKPGHDIEQDMDIMFATVRAAFAGHIRISNGQNRE